MAITLKILSVEYHIDFLKIHYHITVTEEPVYIDYLYGYLDNELFWGFINEEQETLPVGEYDEVTSSTLKDHPIGFSPFGHIVKGDIIQNETVLSSDSIRFFILSDILGDVAIAGGIGFLAYYLYKKKK